MRFALALCLAIASPALPVSAQTDGPQSDLEGGVEMMTEGARRLLRGLMGDVDPAMRDLADRLRDFDLGGIGIDDIGRYQPPELLPNGDIIIRRKPDAPESLPEDGEVAPGEDIEI